MKNNFRFEGISIPLKFITVHPDEESFLKQGRKQFFYDQPTEVQEGLLKEMYKQGMAIHNANEAESPKDVVEPALKYKGWKAAKLKGELLERGITFEDNASVPALVELLVNNDLTPPQE